jgi:hypothetical protein
VSLGDAVFVVVEGKIICDYCGRDQDDHASRVEVEGIFKGFTRYRCMEPIE